MTFHPLEKYNLAKVEDFLAKAKVYDFEGNIIGNATEGKKCVLIYNLIFV